MRVAACAGLVLAVALSAGGCKPKPVTDASEKWQTFFSAEGRFSVLMPGTPVHEAKKADNPLGPVTMHAFLLMRSEVPDGFTVMYNDFPGPIPAGQADAVLDGVVKGAGRRGNTVQEVKKINLTSHPGRELTTIRKGDAVPVMKHRVYLVRNRLYQVMVVTTEADAASPKVSRFLDSFKLIEK
jgi:hypothetical protein